MKAYARKAGGRFPAVADRADSLEIQTAGIRAPGPGKFRRLNPPGPGMTGPVSGVYWYKKRLMLLLGVFSNSSL